MAKRSRPVVVATRVTHRERALIDAAAAMEGQTVTDLVRDAVLPHVRQRLAEEVHPSSPEQLVGHAG